jgi:hypothetical protein
MARKRRGDRRENKEGQHGEEEEKDVPVHTGPF